MEKGKRILAILGILLLVAMYGMTIVAALSGSENSMNYLMAAIYATVVIPALIWIYGHVFKLLRRHNDHLLDPKGNPSGTEAENTDSANQTTEDASDDAGDKAK